MERLIHRAKLFFFPDGERYEIRCVDCGMTLVADPLAPDVEFYVPGECEPQNRLGIETSDGIGAQDTVR